MSRRTLATIAAVAIGVLATAFAVSRIDTAVRKLALPLNHAEVIREQAAKKHINPALIAATCAVTSARISTMSASTGSSSVAN